MFNYTSFFVFLAKINPLHKVQSKMRVGIMQSSDLILKIVLKNP